VNSPRVLALTNDLFLVPRLQDGASGLGFRFDQLEANLLRDEAPARPIPLTEPLDGDEAELVRSIVSDPPALILIDVAAAEIPWRRWLQVLKTSSATRRVPVVAFGPHVEKDALDEARRLGADAVVTRGQLQANLAEILRREARPPDVEGIRAGCAEPASAEASLGIAALLDGRYFVAHEHLERAVLDDPGSAGTIYRPLLHLAVACLHTERGNWRGAQKMLLRMRPWLAGLPGRCRGVDVESLRAALQTLQGQLDRWRDTDVPPEAPVAPPRIGVSG